MYSPRPGPPTSPARWARFRFLSPRPSSGAIKTRFIGHGHDSSAAFQFRNDRSGNGPIFMKYGEKVPVHKPVPLRRTNPLRGRSGCWSRGRGGGCKKGHHHHS
ncbi:hypothetical protein GWI33_014465 [Rhynchophorus ferrugineus]|uniref:Uncharacterized protein n=1 Tax=Rhynchophorus ferrugineus TaxID=354439 RepID=A0A834I1D1_RHYFE|nr:hypothetical protein GWI33_014465 [Rhynchophorus ferrugineus]